MYLKLPHKDNDNYLGLCISHLCQLLTATAACRCLLIPMSTLPGWLFPEVKNEPFYLVWLDSLGSLPQSWTAERDTFFGVPCNSI